ncbi:hypothetical protein Pint_00477 [Pistacia integerrima]|uniref:Uncharacterized protein n=1 Tax=Pistacia integerrima TaxID=434235 RepID=A0ACC0ZNB1_9ROSI|nr:hypothetical protein Pint_00477 [Pistacia integerrima]
MTREPLFPGKDYVHQLRLITEVWSEFVQRNYFLRTSFLAIVCLLAIAHGLVLTLLILYLTVRLLGSPDESSLGFLRSDNARRYVRMLPQYPKQNFSARFPNKSPGIVDLLEKMLVFDPNRRITVDEALCHPYLAALHDINEEPVCPRPFSFDFEHPSFTEEDIKELIYRESVKFNPDPM